MLGGTESADAAVIVEKTVGTGQARTLNRQRSLAGSFGFESQSIPPALKLMNKPRLVAQLFRELARPVQG
jgi:hypothetical protein